jgi:hypothetical protein
MVLVQAQTSKSHIWQVKGLEVKTHGLTSNSCNYFYTNLESLYNQHNYSCNHIWNFHEIGIQASRHLEQEFWLKEELMQFTASSQNFKNG